MWADNYPLVCRNIENVDNSAWLLNNKNINFMQKMKVNSPANSNCAICVKVKNTFYFHRSQQIHTIFYKINKNSTSTIFNLFFFTYFLICRRLHRLGNFWGRIFSSSSSSIMRKWKKMRKFRIKCRILNDKMMMMFIQIRIRWLCSFSKAIKRWQFSFRFNTNFTFFIADFSCLRIFFRFCT